MSDYSKCPYNAQPNKAFFKKIKNCKSGYLAEQEFDLQGKSPRLMSFGSCFASRISKMIEKSDANFVSSSDFVCSKKVHKKPLIKNEFSLPTGNIYTSRHFRQFIERAVGKNDELPRIIKAGKGDLRNSFRPTVYSYKNEFSLRYDDELLLKNFIDEVSKSNILFLTLGLTETWVDKETGLVLPNVPGCGLGVFDEKVYEFVDLKYDELLSDLTIIHHILRDLNSSIEVVLTVSPIPLLATYKNKSVIEASNEAKAVIRAAVNEAVARHKHLYYFPSYDIIMDTRCVGENFAVGNGREISEIGLLKVNREIHRFLGIINHDNSCLDSNTPSNTSVFQNSMKIDVSTSLEPTDISCDEGVFFDAIVASKSFKLGSE